MDISTVGANVPAEDGHFPPFVSDAERRIAEIVVDLTLGYLVALLGSVTNVIIIAVFAKQGFRDSVGISMTVIAIWDLAKCLGCAAQRTSGPISLFSQPYATSWSNISVVVFNNLISFSTFVTSVLAAYVAVERCLCVWIPLKVKTLLTRKVSCLVGTLVSVIVFGWFAVMFGMYEVYWEYDTALNATIAKYGYSSYAKAHPDVLEFNHISGTVWPLASFVVILASTIIISHKLRQASSFRYKEQKQGIVNQLRQPKKEVTSPPTSKRDRQVVKMLLVVVSVYIVCLFPRVTVYLVKHLVYDFYFLRKYHNIFMVVAYIVYLSDLVNGAANLFIFHSMSSSFRETCDELFPCCNRRNKQQKLGLA